MTVKEIINKVRSRDYRIDLDEDTIEKIVYLAYECGKSDGAQHAASLYSSELRNQKERAKKCRYHKLAMNIQGNIEWLYDTNYANDMFETFADDVTHVLDIKEE